MFEGDTLTTDDIGNSPLTAHKVTEKEYKALVEKAESLAPKKIPVGEAVSRDGCTFTVNSLDFQDEIYPSDTSGYYTYWQHEDGYSYLVADVTYTNDNTEYQVPGYSTGALFYVGGKKSTKPPLRPMEGRVRRSHTASMRRPRAESSSSQPFPMPQRTRAVTSSSIGACRMTDRCSIPTTAQTTITSGTS